jgi:hypothetical protein
MGGVSKLADVGLEMLDDLWHRHGLDGGGVRVERLDLHRKPG